MKLHAHPIADLAITSISAAGLTIGQQAYNRSVQVGKNNGVTHWDKTHCEHISDADVSFWIFQKPELVVIGTGKAHRFLSPKLAVQLAQAGVGFECMNTGAAARTYNVLLDEGRNVLGAFIIEP